MGVKLIFVCALYLFQTFLTCHGYKRVCYYTNWSQYRKGIARFLPENIDVNLCTHLIYAFAKLDGNQLAPVEWNDDTKPWRKGMYEKFNDLKLKNPSLKTLLAVGGWNFGSKPFSDMTALPSTRSEFVNSTIKYLRRRSFDGLDIDWEYPASRGGPPQDKVNLASLMKELRIAFEKESAVSGYPRLLLTIAVPADEEKINNGYDVPVIAKNSDFINIMSYDLHGAWDPATGHNSPLYAGSSDSGYAAQKNVKWVADYWLKLGAPRNKLIIGFPLFGRGFTLRDRTDYRVGAEVSGGSDAGPHTKEMGYMSYFEVCKVIADGGKVYRDTEQMVPYLVHGDQWIGYDDIDSFTVKANWVKQNKFGGVMVWSLALDDFTGTACAFGTKFPMTTTLKRLLSQETTELTGVVTNVISSNTEDQSIVFADITDTATREASAKHIQTSIVSDVTNKNEVKSDKLSKDSIKSVSVSNIGGASQISAGESTQMSGQKSGNGIITIISTVEKTVTTDTDTHGGSATTLTNISNKEARGGTVSESISTAPGSVSTASDFVSTASDSVSTASGSVSTASDSVSTSSDSVSSSSDSVSTASSSASNSLGSASTVSDSVSTGKFVSQDESARMAGQKSGNGIITIITTVEKTLTTDSDTQGGSKKSATTLTKISNKETSGRKGSGSVTDTSGSVSTASNIVSTASDSVSTVSDPITTASGSVSTAFDSVSTASDSVSTAADSLSTGKFASLDENARMSGQKLGNGIITISTTVEKTVTTDTDTQGGPTNSATTLTDVSNKETSSGTASGSVSAVSDSVSTESGSISTALDSVSTGKFAGQNELIKTETITSNVGTVKPLVDSGVIGTGNSDSISTLITKDTISQGRPEKPIFVNNNIASGSKTSTLTKTEIHEVKTSGESNSATKPLEATVSSTDLASPSADTTLENRSTITSTFTGTSSQMSGDEVGKATGLSINKAEKEEKSTSSSFSSAFNRENPSITSVNTKSQTIMTSSTGLVKEDKHVKLGSSVPADTQRTKVEISRSEVVNPAMTVLTDTGSTDKSVILTGQVPLETPSMIGNLETSVSSISSSANSETLDTSSKFSEVPNAGATQSKVVVVKETIDNRPVITNSENKISSFTVETKTQVEGDMTRSETKNRIPENRIEPGAIVTNVELQHTKPSIVSRTDNKIETDANLQLDVSKSSSFLTDKDLQGASVQDSFVTETVPTSVKRTVVSKQVVTTNKQVPDETGIKSDISSSDSKIVRTSKTSVMRNVVSQTVDVGADLSEGPTDVRKNINEAEASVLTTDTKLHSTIAGSTLKDSPMSSVLSNTNAQPAVDITNKDIIVSSRNTQTDNRTDRKDNTLVIAPEADIIREEITKTVTVTNVGTQNFGKGLKSDINTKHIATEDMLASVNVKTHSAADFNTNNLDITSVDSAMPSKNIVITKTQTESSGMTKDNISGLDAFASQAGVVGKIDVNRDETTSFSAPAIQSIDFLSGDPSTNTENKFGMKGGTVHNGRLGTNNEKTATVFKQEISRTVSSSADNRRVSNLKQIDALPTIDEQSQTISVIKPEMDLQQTRSQSSFQTDTIPANTGKKAEQILISDSTGNDRLTKDEKSFSTVASTDSILQKKDGVDLSSRAGQVRIRTDKTVETDISPDRSDINLQTNNQNNAAMSGQTAIETVKIVQTSTSSGQQNAATNDNALISKNDKIVQKVVSSESGSKSSTMDHSQIDTKNVITADMSNDQINVDSRIRQGLLKPSRSNLETVSDDSSRITSTSKSETKTVTMSDPRRGDTKQSLELEQTNIKITKPLKQPSTSRMPSGRTKSKIQIRTSTSQSKSVPSTRRLNPSIRRSNSKTRSKSKTKLSQNKVVENKPMSKQVVKSSESRIFSQTSSRKPKQAKVTKQVKTTIIERQSTDGGVHSAGSVTASKPKIKSRQQTSVTTARRSKPLLGSRSVKTITRQSKPTVVTRRTKTTTLKRQNISPASVRTITSTTNIKPTNNKQLRTTSLLRESKQPRIVTSRVKTVSTKTNKTPSVSKQQVETTSLQGELKQEGQPRILQKQERTITTSGTRQQQRTTTKQSESNRRQDQPETMTRVNTITTTTNKKPAVTKEQMRMTTLQRESKQQSQPGRQTSRVKTVTTTTKKEPVINKQQLRTTTLQQDAKPKKQTRTRTSRVRTVTATTKNEPMANKQQLRTTTLQRESNQKNQLRRLTDRARTVTTTTTKKEPISDKQQLRTTAIQRESNIQGKPRTFTRVRTVTTTTRRKPAVTKQQMRTTTLQRGSKRQEQPGILTSRGRAINTKTNTHTTGNQQQLRTRVLQRQLKPKIASMTRKTTIIRGTNPQIVSRTNRIGMQNGHLRTMQSGRLTNASPVYVKNVTTVRRRVLPSKRSFITKKTITKTETKPVLSVSTTGDIQRSRRSISNSDYETHFRKRSLLQATNTGNPGRRSGFNSVLQSLLSIVSDFSSNRGRKSDRSSGTSTRRQAERRRRPLPTARPTAAIPNLQERLQRPRTRGRTQQTSSSTRTADQTNTRVQANRRLSTQARTRAANRILNRGLGITPTEVSSSVSGQNAILQTSQAQLNRSLRGRIRGTASTQRLTGRRQRQRPRALVPTNETPLSQIRRETSQRNNVQTNEPPSLRTRARIRSSEQNSLQNGQITGQLRDSFINQMNDLRANSQMDEKNTNRLRTSLRQSQTGNSQNIGSRRSLRRPVMERNRITVDRMGVLNQPSNAGIRPIEEPRRRLPQLLDLGITDLATNTQNTNVSVIQPTNPGQQTNRALPEQQTNKVIPEQQLNNRLNGQQLNSRLPLQGRSRGLPDQQVNRNVIERNLAVQPNVAAQRILQNNPLNRGSLNQENNILSNNLNGIQNVQQPTNIITRTNRIAPNRQIMPSVMDNSISSKNQMMSKIGRRKITGQIHSSPTNSKFTLFPRNNLRLNSLDTMPTVLNLPQQNTILRTPKSQTTAESTNGLRFDDLKLSAESVGQNTNSLLNQIQSFRTQTKTIEPIIQNKPPTVPITSPILAITPPILAITPSGTESLNSNLAAVNPLNPNTKKAKSKSPTDNISSLLKTRFPQLVPSQISALTNEIQRQVKEVVQSKLTENFLKGQNELSPSKQSPTPIVPSIFKAMSGNKPVNEIKKQVKQQISTSILERKITKPQIDTKQKEQVKVNSLPAKIQGLQMLSKQADTNKANTINLEQLRRELSRSGLPGNLVIQINPAPLLTRRGNQAVNSPIARNGRLGIIPTAQLQSALSPSVPLVSRIRPNNNNILLSKNIRRRKRPRVPLPLFTTMSPIRPRMDAIQSPHELIRSEKGNAAEELSVLPSTPSTSPRQQLRPSNQTAILTSQLKQDVSLPKSEVLWKWQL